ncbi:hypothetical protein BDV98DRAFT_582195 [Pterulicium gracile]|uniref:Uncharacterized protein n=1 Tax=Pterulicium gracile TaxID=1884261 RepID=A0A5C3QLI8_9AGAR|nr:hypothetical protein BDV98DRAFT_582195 [Pterula gracilis]
MHPQKPHEPMDLISSLLLADSVEQSRLADEEMRQHRLLRFDAAQRFVVRQDYTRRRKLVQNTAQVAETQAPAETLDNATSCLDPLALGPTGLQSFPSFPPIPVEPSPNPSSDPAPPSQSRGTVDLPNVDPKETRAPMKKMMFYANIVHPFKG